MDEHLRQFSSNESVVFIGKAVNECRGMKGAGSAPDWRSQVGARPPPFNGETAERTVPDAGSAESSCVWLAEVRP
jgi:hypothetical protein